MDLPTVSESIKALGRDELCDGDKSISSCCPLISGRPPSECNLSSRPPRRERKQSDYDGDDDDKRHTWTLDTERCVRGLAPNITTSLMAGRWGRGAAAARNDAATARS